MNREIVKFKEENEALKDNVSELATEVDHLRMNVGILKELTGNDKQMVRPLFQAPFDLQLQAKFFLGCNEKPSVDAQDEGTWRRLRIVEFGSRFVEKCGEKHLEISRKKYS